ncbi:helix-turn-helix transcriptional regulator [Paenibacillus wynnii]|uniref:HTH luxR-type domain-containing protein n=1 Tax=Paenibacillus wynnii TaxID=268407 RepID=A0A098MFY8_9BACL|nr:helix-turn-helix transcriptional regulator [Paenibacillus wynnii]KGE20457.1 hypothetical protein PWYN_14740 [Paenibacillus wynnii]
MKLIFNKTNAWCSPDDLKEEQLITFQRNVALHTGIHNNTSKMVSSAKNDMKSLYDRALISSVRREMVKISEFITISFVVFLTDEEGNIIDLVCSSPDLQDDVDRVGLGVGICLSKACSGMNAVSLAMEMNSIGVVRGKEHLDSNFDDWNCVCAPLQLEGTIRGYVDISFNRGQQIEFAIPFIKQIAENVTQKWMDNNSEVQQSRLEAVFHDYKLTAREKDVAHLWLQEKSALHISNTLGISEGTVRNIVKNIYTKMNVNERRQFSRKLAQCSIMTACSS